MAQRKIYFNIVDKIVIVIMAIVCIIVGIFRFTQHPVIVVGSSMYPTYTEGDILTTDIHFTPDDIHYDSIIAFDTHKKYHALYIKRVVGLPGDTVRIQNGILYINEEKEKRNYKMNEQDYMSEMVIPEGEYFVLGDNRTASQDSRVIGCIKYEDIKHIIRTNGLKFHELGDSISNYFNERKGK